MSDNDYDFLLEPEKSYTQRFIEKCKSQPFLIGGWVGTLGAVAYGAYRYKTKGPSVSKSVFFVQLRVLAQGVIVTSLFLGLLHQTYKENFSKENKQIKND